MAAQRRWGRKKMGGQAVGRAGPGAAGAFPEGGGGLGSSLSRSCSTLPPL